MSCRRINTAAKEGNVSGAESALFAMSAAGLPPGPRAYHVLLCAYLKAKDLPGALEVTNRATEAGKLHTHRQSSGALQVYACATGGTCCYDASSLGMIIWVQAVIALTRWLVGSGGTSCLGLFCNGRASTAWCANVA